MMCDIYRVYYYYDTIDLVVVDLQYSITVVRGLCHHYYRVTVVHSLRAKACCFLVVGGCYSKGARDKGG